MQGRARTTLGLAAATGLLATGLTVGQAEAAAAGVECATRVDNVPIRVAPRTGSEVRSWVRHAGTVFGCSGGDQWNRVTNLTTGKVAGYIGTRYLTFEY